MLFILEPSVRSHLEWYYIPLNSRFLSLSSLSRGLQLEIQKGHVMVTGLKNVTTTLGNLLFCTMTDVICDK